MFIKTVCCNRDWGAAVLQYSNPFSPPPPSAPKLAFLLSFALLLLEVGGSSFNSRVYRSFATNALRELTRAEATERSAWHAHYKKGSICKENANTARSIQIFLPLQILYLHIQLQGSSSPKKESCRNLPYSFSPDCFVQSGVNANIRSTHFFHRKFTDFLESTRCSFLEAPRTNTRAISLTSGNCQHWILVAAFDHWHSLNIQSKELCSTAVQHLHHSMTRPLLS